MIKRKLVTFCGTRKNGFSNPHPRYDYTGESRSEKSFIKMTCPTYPENLVYYEHFKQSDSYRPSRLSFLLVGSDVDLKVHDFQEYKEVNMIDFNMTQFDSVHSIFTIASKIPSCTELQIHLNAKNLMQTKSDQINATDFQLAFPKCASVTHLKFRWDGPGPADENEKETINFYLATRIPEILNYLSRGFPKLTSVKINLPDQCQCPDWIKMLLENLDLKKSHKITLENGRVICEPIRTRKRPSRHGHGFSSGSASISKAQSYVKPATPKNDVAVISTPPPTPGPDRKPFSNGLPQERIQIKTEKPEEAEDAIDAEEILHPPPPEKVGVYEAVSDDELEAPSPLKKPKVEVEAQALTLAVVTPLLSPPPSTSSMKLEAHGSHRTIGKESRPKNLDWENNDDDEEHENAMPLSPEAMKKVQFGKNEIQTSLKEIVVEIDKDGPHRPQDFIEGIHYERRKPSHPSQQTQS